MSEPTTHDQYIDAAPERFQPLLHELRAAISAAAPDASEVIAYGMPGFRLGGETLAGYAAFSKQCGLYLPAEAIAECADALDEAALKHTKTGVTFTPARPIPADVLRALLDASRRAITP